jgi:hypothetical protein
MKPAHAGRAAPYFESGFLPIEIPGVFPYELPAIAAAAVAGIVLNLVFRALKVLTPSKPMPPD